MAEWSIAAVLKTVEVRASGGSNPSLSATKRGLQDVEFQPCRLFFMPRKLHQKNAPNTVSTHLYGCFFNPQYPIRHIPLFSFCQPAQNAWCNFSAISVKKMHEKSSSFCVCSDDVAYPYCDVASSVPQYSVLLTSLVIPNLRAIFFKHLFIF